MPAPSLLDLLPQGRVDAGVVSCRFPLAMERAAALRSVLEQAGASSSELLALALQLVEWRLTGVAPTHAIVVEGTARSHAVAVDSAADFSAWLGAMRAGPASCASTEHAWMAGEALADTAACAAPASSWSLALGDDPALLGASSRLAGEALAALGDAVLRVLSALAEDPARRLDSIEPVDDAALLARLGAWNATAVARDPDETVMARFDAIAAIHPASVAIVDGDRGIDYRTLQAWSAAIATRLRQAGVQSGDYVGIAMPRSAAAVAATLGVLEAGAAYLPLDLHHPAERLAFMLRDAQVSVVLVPAEGGAMSLPEDVRPLALSAQPESAGMAAPQSPVSAERADPDAVAYVMYTSGSTGTPKGVQIRQRSILRLVIEGGFMPLAPRTRLLHAAPLGFDASTLELWGALLNGGCVVVHDEEVSTGPGLARTIARHGVTSAWLTAALFNAVVDDDPRQLAGLEELFTGGEALSVDHVRRMLAAAPALRLHNGYGPTECTTFTTTHPIPLDLPADATSIPIGRPIADTSLYVLNARGRLVPPGVAGELHIGGLGLARGYLGRPELTATRFVRDPFGVEGDKLYRTGDLVRYTDDGVLEFVGRADQQVKIRGFRIELGEIEASLTRHARVRACAVLARADAGSEKRLVAYVVAEGAAPAAPALRSHLAATLPDYMLPTRYLFLDALPVTANGKLDRRALPAPDRSRPELAEPYAAPSDALEAALCSAFADTLDLEAIGRNDGFFELGGSSLLAVRMLERLRGNAEVLACLHAADADPDTAMAPTGLFRAPTPAAFAAALRASAGHASKIEPARIARGRRDAATGEAEPVAIVAMAGRFPGAADVEAFWRNLCEGRDSITRFAADQLDPAIPASERDDPNYVAARGVIDGVEDFDAAFFGISPREAELMDPQQRIFLELCWECLERAGHVPDATTVPVGVFAGMYNATYYQRHLAQRPDLIARLGAFQVMLDNEKDYIATRIAHKLDLTGPAISVHTACSTSLVAICQAMDSLRAGRCGMALAGGASVTCPTRSGYRYEEGAMLSPDGRTRSFDADARGTVFSDGAAVVLLKRLSDAIADGNPVYAVLRGGAVNNDGARKASFTAPSAEAQAAVVAMAHADARVSPRDVSYVEAHGTATPLGDPIEIEGLRKAFSLDAPAQGACRIGSVKSNVGHLVIAAGAAGVIKTALALHERRIPATLHFSRPNPALQLDESPFVVNDRLHDWEAIDSRPRIAGVSSFGVGGTNAHVVLEQAPALPASDPAEGAQLLLLSARTPAVLASAAARLAEHLESEPGANLADVAWTLAIGRKAFSHRVALTAGVTADAVRQLHDAATADAIARSRPAQAGEVVFLFPGQGATYPGMGSALYAAEPAFREAFDACATALHPELGYDLRERMFGDRADAMLQTDVMQPATFALEYALARQWMSLGLRPAAMIGHSIGEFAAATLAGVFTLHDAARLVARRGKLMQAQPPGGMLSVRAAFDAIAARLPDGLSMAAENAPGNCVVAGPSDALASFQAQLESDGIACRALRTSHAFHSAMMDPVVAEFRREVAAVPRQAPTLPIVSTLTGAVLDAESAVSPDYWARHLREPVRYSSALLRVLETPGRTLLEVGPRTTLSTLARQHPQLRAADAAAVASLADSALQEPEALRRAAGQLWCRGLAPDCAALDRRALRHRLRLPAYPFERRRYWVEAALPSTTSLPQANPLPAPSAQAAAAVEIPMPQNAPVPEATPATAAPVAVVPTATDRRPRLLGQLREVFEDISGFEIDDADAASNFIEIGLDSLMLTQVALQLQKQFPVKITFRQLMGECASLDRLAAMLDAQLPAESAPAPAAAAAVPIAVAHTLAMTTSGPSGTAMSGGGNNEFARQLIAQQMQLMTQQLALLSGAAPDPVAPQAAASAQASAAAPTPASLAAPVPVDAAVAAAVPDEEEAALAHTRYDVKKAFGAIARIDNGGGIQLNARQRAKLDAFIERYARRTAKSKAYTAEHRPHMADPRVVNGFRPLLKEITYQIVMERSKGAHLTDLDGNDYVDALNGFGMSLFGWQPDFVLDAVRAQLELGYEIGPQHPLAGEVARRMCEVTGHDRAALCNTGSEAVLGALRIARTVTGRETVVLFTGAYHGIIDEMIVRGTKKLRAVPAAPGILRNTAEHVLVLDYGTSESMQIIRERASEIAAVLVEPVQSRRPDFRPVEFLRELREVTERAGTLLVFDEVVTGFRAHPAGAQGYFGIDADLATYGKVVGGGYPIGVIAGKRRFMDALDGGQWEFGDDSVPTVGVTYFAGTFVRHPLALAAANAVLQHVQAQGPAMQERLNLRVTALAEELNAFCGEVGAPIEVRHFASVWKTFFLEEHPLQDLLFAMMRSRGVHILDNFPCFFTTAHSEVDFQRITRAFKDSVMELQECEFLPRHAATARTVMDPSRPAVAGARLGRDPEGRPAWFVPNPDAPGKYLKVG